MKKNVISSELKDTLLIFDTILLIIIVIFVYYELEAIKYYFTQDFLDKCTNFYKGGGFSYTIDNSTSNTSLLDISKFKEIEIKN